MKIELAVYNFKLTWPRYEKSIHQEILRRIKTIGGSEFDAINKCWWVPAAQGAKLLDLFWRASYSVDAICAAVDAESNRTATFYGSLVALGVQFAFDASGAIVGVGEGVSPLLQELIAERSDALRPLVLRDRGKVKRKVGALAPLQGPQTVDDAKWDVWMRGVQNAAVRAERDAEMAKVREARRWKKGGENDVDFAQGELTIN